jgi:hypothetical protein
LFIAQLCTVIFIFCYLAKYSNVAGELKIDMNGAVTTLTGSLDNPLDESSYNLDLGNKYIFTLTIKSIVLEIVRNNCSILLQNPVIPDKLVFVRISLSMFFRKHD